MGYRFEIGRAVSELDEATLQRELERLARKLERMSNLDGLTGIANRRCFDDTLVRAISELLAAPVVEGGAELAPGVTTFEFADLELESLSPVQKQLLRTGPHNVQRVQKKLRAFGNALDIPRDAFPPPQTYSAAPPVVPAARP